MKLGTLSAVTVATLLSASAAQAAVIVTIANTGASTVNVGDLITVRVSASTDNPFGIAVLNARVTESDVGIGGAADASIFGAHIVPLDGVPSGVAEAINATVNPALPVNGVTKPTATFISTAGPTFGEPNSTTANRPLFAFNGNTGVDGRFAPQFYSAGNAATTWFYDVKFVAAQTGTFYFSLSPAPTAAEYNTEWTSSGSPVTTTTVTPTISGPAGFAVTIAAVQNDVNELVLSTVRPFTAANNYGASAGTVTVSGAGGFFSSTKLDITGANQTKGHADIAWANKASGPVWVMLWSTGTLPAPAGADAVFTSDPGAGSMWATLQAQYAGFTELVQYNSGQDLSTGFYWDLVGMAGNPTITGIAVVPEPASLGLLALGALGLLSRKRR